MRNQKNGGHINATTEYYQVGSRSQYTDCRNRENNFTSKSQLSNTDSSRYFQYLRRSMQHYLK